MRVHCSAIREGTLHVGAFRNRRGPDGEGEGMSTDWSKYATPEETKRQARVPEQNGVIEMVVGDVREIPEQVVQHAPVQDMPDLQDNRAHTDVKGPKKAPLADTPARYLFMKIWRWVIRYEPTTESTEPS